jgi:ribonucleoside-diphosphate reductase alpha chain
VGAGTDEKKKEMSEVSTGMHVRKRNGDMEPVDLNKIVRAINRCSVGLVDVDPIRVATRTISGLYDGATTAELDELSI